MKRHLLIISILCGMVLPGWAAPRTLSQAKAIAAKFATEYAAQASGKAKKVAKRALTCVQTSQDDMPYYVFNNGDSQGFTIVSADDRMPEIVGYTDSGEFKEDNMPEGFVAFMKAYKATAAAILAGDQKATDNLNKLLAIRSARKTTAVSPLLGSIAWNQTAPYNNLCPIYNGTDRAVTGCVATAMAQIMAYYEYPATLQADIPSYVFNKSKNLSTEAISKGETYDWASMLPQYVSGSYTEAQANAVAKLMFHCGAAVQTIYDESSGADVEPEHLAKYFGYDADLMQKVYRTTVTLSKWIELLDGELKAGRPILYAGDSSHGAHQFVCDGCDENGLYHINWGWGGYENGYFDINILNPDYEGSFPAEDGYTSSMEIIIGIAPDNGKVDTPLVNVGDTDSHISQYTYSDLTWTKQTRSNASDTFTGSVNIIFVNATDTDFSGKVSLGVKDEQGNVKLISSTYDLSINKRVEVDGEYKYYASKCPFEFDYAFPMGCSVLYALYSYDGKEWNTCVPIYYTEAGKRNYLNLKASATEIKQSKRVDLTASIATADELIRNTTSTIDLKLHNNLPEEYLGKVTVYVSDTNEKPSTAAGKYVVTVDAKGDATRTIRVSPTTEKMYVWVDDEAGDCILNGQELSTVTHDAPALTITSAKTNATEGTYETGSAYYTTTDLVKAPCTNEAKATFKYEIKNTGGRTYRTFNITLFGLPSYNTKKISKTLTLEPNSVNYITIEATPEEMGSRFIECALTMDAEKDDATLTYEAGKQRLDCVSGQKYYTLANGMLAVYVSGFETTGIQQATADDIFADSKTAKVYNLQGVLIDGSATRESFEKLPQGIYVVNGKKLLKK